MILIPTPAPDPRVKLVVQPMRVKTLTTAPTSPPRVNPSVSSSSDSYSNPRIKKSKINKIPQILQTKHKQAAPWKVQRQLRHSPRNGGTNFYPQAAHHLGANHLFKLPHAFHIYNNQGKKKTIDTLIMVSGSDT